MPNRELIGQVYRPEQAKKEKNSRFDANGESIFTTAMGQASETGDQSVKSMLEFHIVTDGTGYFAHVNGSFTVKRLIKFSADGLTGRSDGNFNGYLRLR